MKKMQINSIYKRQNTSNWVKISSNFSSCVQLVVPLNCLLAGEIAPQGTHTTSTPLLLILLLVGHSLFKSQVINICNYPKIYFRVLGSVIRPILAEACKSQELRHGRRVLWKFSFISDNLDLGGGWVGLLVSGGSPDSWIRGSRANNSHQNIILKYTFFGMLMIFHHMSVSRPSLNLVLPRFWRDTSVVLLWLQVIPQHKLQSHVYCTEHLTRN